MRKLIYISLLALVAGCTPLTAPSSPPPTGISAAALSSYFWHDTTYRYQSSSGVTHSLSVQGGETIIHDNNQIINKSTTFTVSNANSSYSMSGFSNSDLFALDSSIQIVKDTAPPVNVTETIRSIASITPQFGQAKLYAASDSVLYEVDPGPAPMLKKLGSIPSGYTLAEDAQNQLLFAYMPEGDSIMWTSDNGSHWTTIPAVANAKITAFTSAATNIFYDICWFACGEDIYRVSVSGLKILITQVASMPSSVNALAAYNNGVTAGLANGSLYLVPDLGPATQLQTVPDKLLGIAFVASGFNPILAATPSGVYSIPGSGPVTKVSNGNLSVSAIYSTGNSIFAAVPDSVLHFNPSGTLYDEYANPLTGAVTQFAHPTNQTDPSQGIYVLSGTTIFRRDSDATGSRWTQVNQGIPSHPQPGALVMLTDSMNWLAGYVENMSGKPRGYAYQASGSGPYAQVTLDNVAYNNVFMVRYTAYSNGVADTTDVPQYLIYYEKGIGPVQIEKTENGVTTKTTIAK